MKPTNYLAVTAGIAGLIAVRFLEGRLFYDPFLNYFHEADRQAIFPNYDMPRLILSHIFRFLLNFGLSLIIFQNIFLNKKWTAQAAVMIIGVFALTFPIYLYCIGTHFSFGYLFAFYIRRFVIQPLVILILIPIFYYRRKTEKPNYP